MILQILAAGLISVLSGMGVGGGGLFVIYLSLFTDTPQLVAQGMNLLFFLFSSGASMLIHLRERNLFFSAIIIMAAAGIMGALLGSGLAEYVSQALLRKIFGTMLAVSGILSLKRREQPMREPGKKDGGK